MKKKGKKVLSLFLCCIIALSVMPVPWLSASADQEDNTVMTLTETKEITLGGQTVPLTLTVTYPAQTFIHDNSVDDLKALNGGTIDITYGENEYPSFINGKFTDYKITDVDSAISAFSAVRTLLGFKGSPVSVIPLGIKEADNGDCYYTFQQNVGAIMLSDCYITVGADKDGNALCISNDLDLAAGTVDLDENMISYEDAKNSVYDAFGEDSVIEETEPLMDIDRTSSNLCWIVYLCIATSVENGEAKSLYYKIYIDSASGNIVNYTVTDSLDDYQEDGTSNDNNVFFECQTELMTFTDYLGNKVELPVSAVGDSGEYYFIDTERKIICFDTDYMENSFFTGENLYSFADPSEVNPVYVSVFENMRKVYDVYADHGIYSIDGAELPLAVCLGFKQYGKEFENACYSNRMNGWGTFLFSSYPISAGVDVIGHEFTHGVKSCISGDISYENSSGAIDESYADILGNMTQLIDNPDCGDIDKWELGEETGKVIRSMSNPHEYRQPKYVGDIYFVPKCENPNYFVNDYGGVHTNNSILSSIAYKLYKNGLSVEENYNLWLDTFMVFQPNADYDDVYAYIRYIAGREGLSEQLDLINAEFENANIAKYSTCMSLNDFETPAGCIRVTFDVENLPEDYDVTVFPFFGTSKAIVICDPSGDYVGFFYPGEATRLKLRFQKDISAEGEAPDALPVNPETQNNYTFGMQDETVHLDFLKTY